MLKIAVAGLTGILTLAMSGPSVSMQEGFLPAAPDPRVVQAAPPAQWGDPGPFMLFLADPRIVDAACRGSVVLAPGQVVLACTRDDRRAVLMPNPCLYQHEYYAKLLCHEQAHLTRPGLPGWRH